MANAKIIQFENGNIVEVVLDKLVLGDTAWLQNPFAAECYHAVQFVGDRTFVLTGQVVRDGARRKQLRAPITAIPTKVKPSQLNLGDIVGVVIPCTPAWFHVGLYIGNDRVVHLTKIGAGRAEVQITDVRGIAGGCQLYRVDLSLHCDAPEVAVRRALGDVGLSVPYRFLKKNCQHWVAKWIVGESRSWQVEQAIDDAGRLVNQSAIMGTATMVVTKGVRAAVGALGSAGATIPATGAAASSVTLGGSLATLAGTKSAIGSLAAATGLRSAAGLGSVLVAPTATTAGAPTVAGMGITLMSVAGPIGVCVVGMIGLAVIASLHKNHDHSPD